MKTTSAASVKKICIVTTRHVSYNPRVLKEADAFFGQGHAVTVVTVNNHPAQFRFDQELMQKRDWCLKSVNFRREEKGEKRYWLYLSLKQKFFALLGRVSFGFGIAERAALKPFDALTKMATAEKADVYIAHHAEALSPAYKAAKKNNAAFGFDAEDFHTGMNEDGRSREDALTAYLEEKYLPHCDYFTAASKGIGEAYATKYNIKKGQTILNVFPVVNLEKRETTSPVKFYWYSQVIGPNRSLETLLEAGAQLKGKFQIHLRGSFQSEAYKQKLKTIVSACKLDANVFFHPPILADDLIADAARYDIGLALELAVSVNRNICVTNKVFSYVMSGLAIIGTDTQGQKEIFSKIPEAVKMCRMNDVDSLAKAMQAFLQNHAALSSAKDAARRAALEHFNWEKESEKLLSYYGGNVTKAQSFVGACH